MNLIAATQIASNWTPDQIISAVLKGGMGLTLILCATYLLGKWADVRKARWEAKKR